MTVNVAHVALRQAIVTLQIVHVAAQVANVETEDAIVAIQISNVADKIARGKLHERSRCPQDQPRRSHEQHQCPYWLVGCSQWLVGCPPWSIGWTKRRTGRAQWSAGAHCLAALGQTVRRRSQLATRTASPKTPRQCHAGSYSRIKPGHPAIEQYCSGCPKFRVR